MGRGSNDRLHREHALLAVYREIVFPCIRRGPGFRLGDNGDVSAAVEMRPTSRQQAYSPHGSLCDVRHQSRPRSKRARGRYERWDLMRAE